MKKEKKHIDITGRIGPKWDFDANGELCVGKSEWPMYSYERPSAEVYNIMANVLINKGWTEEEIGEFLLSKYTRWLADSGPYCKALENAGNVLAEEAMKVHKEVKEWVAKS